MSKQSCGIDGQTALFTERKKVDKEVCGTEPKKTHLRQLFSVKHTRIPLYTMPAQHTNFSIAAKDPNFSFSVGFLFLPSVQQIS